MPRHSPHRQKQKRPECLRANDEKKEGLLSLGDAEWSTYDVILLSSRLGARPNPLQIGNTPSFTSGSSVIRKRSEPVFGGISTYKSAWRLESGRECRETIPRRWRVCSY